VSNTTDSDQHFDTCAEMSLFCSAVAFGSNAPLNSALTEFVCCVTVLEEFFIAEKAAMILPLNFLPPVKAVTLHSD